MFYKGQIYKSMTPEAVTESEEAEQLNIAHKSLKLENKTQNGWTDKPNQKTNT